MSNKTELVAALRRCVAVVEGEADLLKDWEALLAGSPRAAACRVVRRAITSGDSSPLAWVQELLARAQQLDPSEVESPPTSGHKDLISHAEDRLASRQPLDPGKLTSTQFDNALVEAQDNANASADIATEVFEDCTGESP